MKFYVTEYKGDYYKGKHSKNRFYNSEDKLFVRNMYLNFKIATDLKNFAIINEGKPLIIGLAEVIEFNEILKAYGYKKLTRDKIYDFKSFTAKLTDRYGLLSIKFKVLDDKYKLDYTEAQILSAQISKSIQRVNYFEEDIKK